MDKYEFAEQSITPGTPLFVAWTVLFALVSLAAWLPRYWVTFRKHGARQAFKQAFWPQDPFRALQALLVIAIPLWFVREWPEQTDPPILGYVQGLVVVLVAVGLNATGRLRGRGPCLTERLWTTLCKRESNG